MRGNVLLVCCFAAFLSGTAARPAPAQREVYHPGETYDSLQAGLDAHVDAEAERRAMIGRQVMIEEQIVQQNTWADPQDKYRPVRPESYGPILPKSYVGPTLADVSTYSPRDGGPVYYGGATAPIPADGGVLAGVPVFQPWPRVPNDIWGAPYYGYVRQPIGHAKIWTGRLSYIYKPIYATPFNESPRPVPRAAAPGPRWPLLEPGFRAADTGSSAALLNSPPPPPKPAIPTPAQPDAKPGKRPDLDPPKGGQEI
ncbi:MAG: hypothetical protein ACLP9L_10450 [Thermoguttaceae bacterium]